MSRSNIPAHWTPVQIAQYKTIHNYQDPKTGKRGAAAMGPKLGKSERVVSNEVNPDVPGHKQGLEDSIAPQLIAEDYQILYAYSAALHHISIPLPDWDNCSDVELLNQFAAWHAAVGRTNREIHKALEDKKIKPHEVKAVKNRAFEHMRECFRFLHRLEAIAEPTDD